MSNYPNADPNLKTDYNPNHTSAVESHTAGHNATNGEINAIGTELGHNPRSASLEARASSATAVVNLLGQLKQGVKDILGSTNWYDAVPATLASIWAKFNGTTGHTHTGTLNNGPVIPSSGIASTLDGKTLTNTSLTTPKVTTSINDANGNEIIKTPATGSAVNEITVTNGAAGSAVKVEATGGDTDIQLHLTGKGAKKVVTDLRRQGGSATDFATPGTTTRNDTKTLMQVGCATSDATVGVTITFPTAYTGTPVVIANKASTSGSAFVMCEVYGITSTTFSFNVFTTGAVRAVNDICWIAVGPVA